MSEDQLSASLVEDIKKLLQPVINSAVRLRTLKLISGLNEAGRQSMLEQNNCEVLSLILNLLNQLEASHTAESEEIFRLLINSSVHDGSIADRLTSEDGFLRLLYLQCCSGEEGDRLRVQKLQSILLSNLTVSDKGCESLLNQLSTQDSLAENIRRLVVAIRKNAADVKPSEDGDNNERLEISRFLCFVLRNLTQTSTVRQILSVEAVDTDKSFTLFNSLATTFKVLCDRRHLETLKEPVVDVFRNCCFDVELHPILIKCPNDELLVALLYPLIGNEQFADDENDSFPIDLQYMETEKTREPNVDIRVKLLEALYQMCATSDDRVFLRDKGIYYILREYHKWETVESAQILCENVIGVLIRTEDEIGVDNLKSLQHDNESEEVRGIN